MLICSLLLQMLIWECPIVINWIISNIQLIFRVGLFWKLVKISVPNFCLFLRATSVCVWGVKVSVVEWEVCSAYWADKPYDYTWLVCCPTCTRLTRWHLVINPSYLLLVFCGYCCPIIVIYCFRLMSFDCVQACIVFYSVALKLFLTSFSSDWNINEDWFMR